MAQVVSVQGIAELRRANNTVWQPVEPDTQLCAGDQIRIRRHGRAAIRLINDSKLEIDQKTTITFSQKQGNESTSLLDLFTDALHILTRTPKPLKIKTPYINAAVEG